MQPPRPESVGDVMSNTTVVSGEQNTQLPSVLETIPDETGDVTAATFAPQPPARPTIRPTQLQNQFPNDVNRALSVARVQPPVRSSVQPRQHVDANANLNKVNLSAVFADEKPTNVQPKQKLAPLVRWPSSRRKSKKKATRFNIFSNRSDRNVGNRPANNSTEEPFREPEPEPEQLRNYLFFYLII